ncbi:HEAT repeat domain-containing protein [Paenibacillus piri]|uniref:HEAT repeat domain-containing protein n=1 Tax=Paenibacillus piri TaxID=2547395 RepID=A0A4R5KEM2_9BACL|nr:HEAT repeat domain-containing protein [Paenibacillus piri]TDF93849.1 hypothetical protein E1757_26050 [Paenibacillus piri]
MRIDPFEALQPALFTAAVLGIIIVAAFGVLYVLRARNRRIEARTAQYLEKHHNYFNYISINIDGPELLPPPGPLDPDELIAIRVKLLEWIETFGGVHRAKLTDLCREMGLVELERKRLHSPRHWERIDAAYHLGVMRAKECTGELLTLLEHEADDATAFVVGRAAAKCAGTSGELRRLILRLAKHHPQSRQLIADIMASSELDSVPVYLELLQSGDENLINVALTGLSGRNEAVLFPVLEQLAASEHKEIRIKASKLLLEYPHLLAQERIESLIRHPDWEIRASAVKAAGSQRLPVFMDSMKRGLTDESWWVRYYSAKSMAGLGLEGFQTLCETASSSEDELSRDTAWDAIHQELESAAVLAAQDIRHILHFNRLSHLYETIFNESYTSHPAKAASFGS